MIETLFGYNAVDKNKGQRKKEPSFQDPSPQYVQIIDSKKSQNLSILLRALNVTMEEVCDALLEGDLLSSNFRSRIADSYEKGKMQNTPFNFEVVGFCPPPSKA